MGVKFYTNFCYSYTNGMEIIIHGVEITLVFLIKTDCIIQNFKPHINCVISMYWMEGGHM